MALEQVSTFVLPNEYQRQATEARRRRRMAEMLAQQAYQPSDISAPIPTAAPLVQGLQAFLAARAERKADEAEESAKETASREARQYLKALTEEPDTTTDAVQPETKAAPTITMPQFEDGRITAPTGIEMGAPAPMVAPQIQLSRYNLTPGQRRAAALEGMLTSENPMVQRIAGAIYPTLQPEKPKLQIGAIDLSKLTPESARLVAEFGRPQDIQYAEPDEKAAPTEFARLLSERNALPENDPRRAAYDRRIAKETRIPGPTVVNTGGRTEPLEYIIGPDGQPMLVPRSQAVGKRRAPPPQTPRVGPTGDSSVDKRQYRTAKRELQNSYTAVNDFLQALRTTPKEESLVGEKAGALSTKYKLALSAVRVLQNTGVINVGELPFLEDALRDPQKISQLFNPGSRETITGQINALADLLEAQSTTLDESYGYDVVPLRGSETRRANRVPAAAAAAGITQEEWDNSTAEERKPWL